MIAELEYQPGVIIARTPYNPAYVETLKRRIPAAYRQWEPESKVWIISILVERDLLMLCHSYFAHVHIIGKDEEPPAHQPTNSYAALHLLPSAPPELVDSAYRCLARLFHPDRNPDPQATTQMQQLNAAYEALRNREAS